MKISSDHTLSRKKYHFGKLYRDNYEIWLKLQEQTGVVFDLLYDPLGWRTLLAHPEVMSKPTLCIHQGGVLGNESMPQDTKENIRIFCENILQQ